MIVKIISGGQTGVDRAALDFGLEKGLKLGGWCPKGRKSEDGAIPEKYPLKETQTENYQERTLKNVADSDGTLVIALGQPMGGTAFTIESAFHMEKPYFLFFFDRQPARGELSAWLEKHEISVLNIAGPRESEVEGIYRSTLILLEKLYEEEFPSTQNP